MESALEMVLSTAAALSGLEEVHPGAGRSGKQRDNNTRRSQALEIIANRVFLSAQKKTTFGLFLQIVMIDAELFQRKEIKMAEFQLNF